MSWHRIKKPDVCRACDHSDWCMVNETGQEYLCMRVESPTSITLIDGSIGWVHKTGSEPTVKVFRKREEPSRAYVDCESLVSGWIKRTKPEWIVKLADILGVTPGSLIELKVCWAPEEKAFAWPQRDGNGKIVGIRLRNTAGEKWSVTGGRNGLFMPYVNPKPTLFVVEGATDTAAALSLGLYAIGRPSCNGGSTDLVRVIGRLGVRKVVIVADNDTDHYRPSGEHFCPGIDGGVRLSEQMPVPCCLMTLPCKDFREARQLGIDDRTIQHLIDNYQWIMPKEQHANK